MSGDADQKFARGGTSPERYQALFRLLCFIVLFVGLLTAASIALYFALGAAAMFKLSLWAELAPAVSALLATFVMTRVTGEPFGAFGLGGRRGPRNFLFGLAVGMALVATMLLVMSLLGGYSFGAVSGNLAALRGPALTNGALFLAVAVAEEGLWRGYGFVQLSRAVSFWPAAIALGLLFGGAHLANGGENLIGGLTAGLFGVAMACSFRFTGSLWLALGLHAGWDYAESFLFGVPDSGLLTKETLLHPAFHGPVWLTGGSVGPEGSVLMFAALAAIVLLAWLLRERAPRQG